MIGLMTKGQELLAVLSQGTHSTIVRTTDDIYEQLSLECQQALRYFTVMAGEHREGYRKRPDTIETFKDAQEWVKAFNACRGDYPGLVQESFKNGEFLKVLEIFANNEDLRAQELHSKVQLVKHEASSWTGRDALGVNNEVIDFLRVISVPVEEDEVPHDPQDYAQVRKLAYWYATSEGTVRNDMSYRWTEILTLLQQTAPVPV